MSIVLLGTVGVAVLVATSAALVGARTSDEKAKSQATIAEAADYMTDTDPENIPYVACNTGTTAALIQQYQNGLDARFGTGTVSVVDVRFWDRPTGSFRTVCGYGSGYRLQQVALQTAVSGVSRDLTVIKRPATIPTLDLVAAPPAPPYAAGSGQAVVSLTPGINGG